jgi:hypothetical protein
MHLLPPSPMLACLLAVPHASPHASPVPNVAAAKVPVRSTCETMPASMAGGLPGSVCSSTSSARGNDRSATLCPG